LASGLPLSDNREFAVIATLSLETYVAIERGQGNTILS
jgi:hypothetical protein